MANKKEQKINELQEKYNKITEENKDLDVNMYLAKVDDLPELGEIEIYNYEADIEETKDRADGVLNSLLDLYLGDAAEHIKSHPYIQNKVKEDSLNYAETLFLIKMTRKSFISQLRQVDNGDNNARMHEVINQTMAQVRENMKFATNVKSDLENFYKDLRKDLGLNEIENKQDVEEDTSKQDGIIMDSRKMNDMIGNYMKNKKD